MIEQLVIELSDLREGDVITRLGKGLVNRVMFGTELPVTVKRVSMTPLGNPLGCYVFSVFILDGGNGRGALTSFRAIGDEPLEVSRVTGAPASIAKADYPHSCPRCGSPAYVGLLSVECSVGGCQ